jgi:hypothetical protein
MIPFSAPGSNASSMSVGRRKNEELGVPTVRGRARRLLTATERGVGVPVPTRSASGVEMYGISVAGIVSAVVPAGGGTGSVPGAFVPPEVPAGEQEIKTRKTRQAIRVNALFTESPS